MSSSRLLDALPRHLADDILQRSELVTCRRGEVLLNARQPASFVYFQPPVLFQWSSLISMAVSLESGNTVEAATVGSDGFAGISSFLGMEHSDITAFVQIEGEALRLPIAVFRKYMDDERFRAALGAFTAKTLATITQTTACNTFHPVHERLARWLLLIRDATERDELPLTQDFIAVMLGTHRPTVSIAVRLLESAGLIEHRRGVVRIVEPDALADAACECYQLSSWNRAAK